MATTVPLIPRTVLFGNPERANVQISPDGAHLSWLASLEGVLNVWVAPAGDPGAARPVTADVTRPVREYHWTLDGKRLLYRQDKAGNEDFHLFAVDIAAGTVTDLLPIDGARVDLVSVSPAHPARVVVSVNDRDPQVFDVWRLDLDSGEKVCLLHNDAGYMGFHVDRDLRLRFVEQMAPDGARIVFAPPDAADPAGPWREHERIGPADSLTTGLVGFDRTGRSYYAYDSRGRDTGALFLVDAATGEKTPILADDRTDVAGVLTHPTEHHVQAVELNYDRPRWVAIDEAVAGDLAALTALGGFPHVIGRTLDDRTWTVVFNSDSRSPHYWRWDRDAQKATFLFSARPALDEQPLVPMEPVTIRARDGLEMVAYLSRPRQEEPGPTPMVLLVHGGPWARDEWGWNPQHQMLANRGYAVLSVNFRGSTGFGKRFLNAGNREWGKAMQDDLSDAVAWAIAGKIALPDRIAVMGGSYGGYATLAGLTMTPELFACGVDIVGPSNLITLLETIPPYWVPVLALFHDRLGDPRTEEGKQALLAVSPLTHADRIARPLLIGQGANDPRVKKSESDQIVAAMRAKHIPVSYVVFPDEGHGFARPENNLAFHAVIEAFLAVHLGGRYQPITDAELAASSLTIEAGSEWLPGLPGETA